MFRARLAVAAIVKDEGASIFEWLAHHAALGVERFFLYDNGSSDDTRAEIAAFPGPARIDVIDWPMPQGQFPAYADALTRFGRTSRWMAFIDADEFLIPMRGETLPAILEDFAVYGGMAVPFTIFGSSGFDRRPDGLVLENYRRRAPDGFVVNGYLKCIVRPERMTAEVTTPHLLHPRPGHAIVLETGRAVAPRTGGLLDPPFTAQRLRLHHYVVKSREDFAGKRARGLAAPADPRDDAFFRGHDRNEVADDTALPFAAAIHDAIARRGTRVRRRRLG